MSEEIEQRSQVQALRAEEAMRRAMDEVLSPHARSGSRRDFCCAAGADIMPLKDGAIYRTPDGKRFRAKMEPRRYTAEPAWTLVPVNLDDTATDPGPTRERLRKLLFLEQGQLVYFDFDSGRLVQDTGWTVADLWPE